MGGQQRNESAPAQSLSRRSFLAQSAAAVAAVPFLASRPWAAPAGANDRIRICIAGVHSRGVQHVSAFLRIPQVEIAWICDVDEGVGKKQVDRIQQATGKAPQFAQDLRKVLDDKDVDAVAIATPNHWHTLAAYWSVEAGKDVLVEKPLSHNLAEGRRLVNAARHHKRIVQHATQYRSAKCVREGIEFLKAGKLGKVTMARAIIYKRRGGMGKVAGPQPVPPGVDYNLWLGPAPEAPILREKFHYDWHWQWPYGNGEIGNQAVHQMDLCRLGLGETLPKTAIACGGRFGWTDDGEVPNTMIALFDYGNGRKMIAEVRSFRSPDYKTVDIGEIFYGTEGYMTIGHYGDAIAYMGKNEEKVEVSVRPGKDLKSGSPTDYDNDHFLNFLSAMRSRKYETLYADVLEGHLTCCHTHLANISYRTGKEVPFDAKRGAFADDPEASETFGRMQDHLRDNKIAMTDTKYQLGRLLHVDAATETLGDDKEANALLTREYRKPFVVPEKVG